MAWIAAGVFGPFAPAISAADLKAAAQQVVHAEYPSLKELYLWLHANPELSFAEKVTARRVAAELRAAKLEVTEGVGGHGVVGVLQNGSGPTVLLRGDLDGLPVKELTGLAYASTATGRDDAGREVPVMHACGHDIHMTCLVGAARILVKLKDHWRGTLVFIGQPAEERVGGARAMVADGLYTRFPKPDFCLALHVAADQPAGTLGYTEGFSAANVDSVDIVVRGVGGHGAYPHTTRDPVVLAAELVLALQTIVSREVNPTEPAVITVGTIHGGSKRNIISDQVTLQLTLRSYSDGVRKQLLESVRRISDGLGRAAGLPEDRLPVVTLAGESAAALYNDPALTQRLVKAFRAWLGEGSLIQRKPTMGSEDFGELGQTADRVPVCMFNLGTVSPASFAASLKSGKSLPSLHSGFFAPDVEPSIQTGVTGLTAAVLELAGRR